MKKFLLSICLISLNFFAFSEDKYNSQLPQTIIVETHDISVDNLTSFAKEWFFIAAKMADNESTNVWYNIETSFLSDDVFAHKVYGQLDYGFSRGLSNLRATFRLIIECKENKVRLTMCGGNLRILSDHNVQTPTKMKKTDGDMEWEQISRSFKKFFGEDIYNIGNW
ncbi:hypothetical protein FACS1894153_3100 [Bacteroidia bacterium]|nr:hypothetical protein FACS1894153_3100 [Bacteroidia bacterium]